MRSLRWPLALATILFSPSDVCAAVQIMYVPTQVVHLQRVAPGCYRAPLAAFCTDHGAEAPSLNSVRQWEFHQAGGGDSVLEGLRVYGDGDWRRLWVEADRP